MLFPTHRVVSGLPPELWERLPELLAERWDLEEVADVRRSNGASLAPPAACARSGSCAGTARRRCMRGCAARPSADLDVAAVETLVLNDLLGLDADAIAGTDRIAYRHRADDAAVLVDAAAPRTAVALLVPAPTVADVEAVAEAERDDAAQVDVLLPEDPRRHGLQPARSLRPVTAEHWLEVCRAMRDAVVAAVAGVPRAQRADELGRGAGGDMTVAIDQAAEDAAFAVLAAVAEGGEGFTVVSEEVGERSFGGGGRWRVVIDPIDGSLNAKRGLPLYALSVAIADGPAMADVALGYVFDLGNGEEWIARRGAGATVDGAPLGSSRPLGRLQLVALEATRPEHLAPACAALPGEVERVRVLGSLALALCHLADGRVDAVASLRPNGARSIDIAAAPARWCARPAARSRCRMRRGRSGRRRSISSGARGSSPPATTSACARVAALLGIGPAVGVRRIRASMRA